MVEFYVYILCYVKLLQKFVFYIVYIFYIYVRRLHKIKW